MEWPELSPVAASLIWLARYEAGLTQAELADRAGVEQSTISAYERGIREPTLPQLLRFLKAAGFELRLHLAPYDDHDDLLAAWEETLTPQQRCSNDQQIEALWRAGPATSVREQG